MAITVIEAFGMITSGRRRYVKPKVTVMSPVDLMGKIRADGATASNFILAAAIRDIDARLARLGA